MVSVEFSHGDPSVRLQWRTDNGKMQESLEAGKSCPVVCLKKGIKSRN